MLCVRRKEWIEKVYNVINDVIKNFSEISKEREWSDEAFCFMTLLYYCWVICWGNTNLHVCLGCASRSLFGRNCVSSSENDKFKVSWYSFLLTFTTNYCRLILFHLYVELRSHSLVITDYFYGLRFTWKIHICRLSALVCLVYVCNHEWNKTRLFIGPFTAGILKCIFCLHLRFAFCLSGQLICFMYMFHVMFHVCRLLVNNFIFFFHIFFFHWSWAFSCEKIAECLFSDPPYCDPP